MGAVRIGRKFKHLTARLSWTPARVCDARTVIVNIWARNKCTSEESGTSSELRFSTQLYRMQSGRDNVFQWPQEVSGSVTALSISVPTTSKPTPPGSSPSSMEECNLSGEKRPKSLESSPTSSSPSRKDDFVQDMQKQFEAEFSSNSESSKLCMAMFTAMRLAVTGGLNASISEEFKVHNELIMKLSSNIEEIRQQVDNLKTHTQHLPENLDVCQERLERLENAKTVMVIGLPESGEPKLEAEEFLLHMQKLIDPELKQPMWHQAIMGAWRKGKVIGRRALQIKFQSDVVAQNILTKRYLIKTMRLENKLTPVVLRQHFTMHQRMVRSRLMPIHDLARKLAQQPDTTIDTAFFRGDRLYVKPKRGPPCLVSPDNETWRGLFPPDSQLPEVPKVFRGILERNESLGDGQSHKPQQEIG